MTPPIENRALPDTICESPVMSSSPNTPASAGRFERKRKRTNEAASKACGSLDEELDDVLFSDSVVKSSAPSSGNEIVKEGGVCETQTFMGSGESNGAVSALCEEDIFGGSWGDEKQSTDGVCVKETQEVGGVSRALENLNGLVSGGGIGDKELRKATLGETSREERTDGLGGTEDELLCGLYPEDFSFFMNCSAFLPHENTSRSSSGEGGPGGEGGCSREGDHPWKHPSHETVLAESHGPTVPSAPALYPSTHPLTGQLPRSCSSPPAAAASSLHKPKTRHPHPPLPPPPHPPASALDRIDYPTGTFYGLPLTVQKCLEEHRRISKLYGKY